VKVVFLRPKVVFAGHEGRLRLTGLVVFYSAVEVVFV